MIQSESTTQIGSTLDTDVNLASEAFLPLAALQPTHALEPDRVLLLPDGVEDLWSADYADLVGLA